MPSVTLCAQSPFVFPVSRSRIIAAQRAYIVTRVHTCWYCKLYLHTRPAICISFSSLVHPVDRGGPSASRRRASTGAQLTIPVYNSTRTTLCDLTISLTESEYCQRQRDTVSCAACGSDLSSPSVRAPTATRTYTNRAVNPGPHARRPDKKSGSSAQSG